MGKIYGGNLWGKFMGKIYGKNLWGKFMVKSTIQNIDLQRPLAVVGWATQSPPEGAGGSLVTTLVLYRCKIPSDGVLIGSGTLAGDLGGITI